MHHWIGKTNQIRTETCGIFILIWHPIYRIIRLNQLIKNGFQLNGAFFRKCTTELESIVKRSGAGNMYCVPLLHLNLNGKSNGTETKFKFNGALFGNKHMEHTVRVPHDENPQELFYIIKLTQIHDAESAWRYSKEYRSCRQISFIHSWRCSRRWMDEGIQYNTEEWRWKKTIPMSFYNVILCPYHGTVLAIQIQIHVTHNAAGRAAKQVKWNCDPLKKWWRASISAEYPNCVCNKYIIQYGTVRYVRNVLASSTNRSGYGS